VAAVVRQCVDEAREDERTEDLRKAMVDFRAVFEELVEVEAEPSACS